MKEYNLNELRTEKISIKLDDKGYTIGFIPYIIEKDIYTHLAHLNEIFQNMSLIKDEDIDNMRKWLNEIIKHPKNGNDVSNIVDIFADVGFTEIVMCMICLVQFITKRILNMTKVFGSDEAEKKTTEILN